MLISTSSTSSEGTSDATALEVSISNPVFSTISSIVTPGKYSARYRIAATYSGKYGNRCDAYSLINDRNVIFTLYLFAYMNKIFCFFNNFIVDFLK